MPHQKIIDTIKKGSISPVYLLGGDEPFFIDQVTNYIEKNILDESEVAFNLDIFYGLEVVPEKIKAICREYPMMAERRIVIIKEAQKVDDLEALDDYINSPNPTTTLVIAKKGGAFDQRRKVYNPSSNKNIALLNAKKIPDYKLADWIKKWMDSKSYAIDHTHAQLLAEHLGSDLNKIVGEIDKLTIALPAGSRITAKHIEDNIGISKDFNIFELQKAISFNNRTKAYQIILYFIENPKFHPIQVTVASLNTYFTKLMLLYYSPDKSDKGLASQMGINPYFLKEYKEAARHYPARKVLEIIALLREYDLKSKGYLTGSSGSSEWQKELLYRILN